MSGVEELDKEVVIKVANGDKMKASKKGKIRLTTGWTIVNLNALIVPELSYNLLSVKRINNEGKVVIFEKEKATITKEEKVIMECAAQGNLYVAKFKLPQENGACNVSKNSNLWHQRLGHLNYNSLKK